MGSLKFILQILYFFIFLFYDLQKWFYLFLLHFGFVEFIVDAVNFVEPLLNFLHLQNVDILINSRNLYVFSRHIIAIWRHIFRNFWINWSLFWLLFCTQLYLLSNLRRQFIRFFIIIIIHFEVNLNKFWSFLI